MSQKHLNTARASLQQSLSWYSSFRRHGQYTPNQAVIAAVAPELSKIQAALAKLEQKVIRIAAFGLVSRGKSAVINALVGQEVFKTGAIHGVTQYPQSVRWQPAGKKKTKSIIEYIDTPGLDEIAGESRAEMARQVAAQSDLILFVVAGDINRTEYNALSQLRKARKPIILVFNKIDLYPQVQRAEIYQKLRKFGAGRLDLLPQILSPAEIVMVSAAPQAILVETQNESGETVSEWHKPEPFIQPLRDKIIQILRREGKSLLAINSLLQAREAEINIAQKTINLREKEAEKLIWQYAKYKAMIVALNPFALLDVVAEIIADLWLIRKLSKLYGLPLTTYQVGKLWRKIMLATGGLLLGEMATGAVLGTGKTAVTLALWENPLAITTYATTGIIQGAIAGYSTYAIGQVAKVYLEKGCSWGNLGSMSVIKSILAEIDTNTVIYRLQQELSN